MDLTRSVEEVNKHRDTSTALSDGRDQMAVVQRNDEDTDRNVRMLSNETFNPFENARTDPCFIMMKKAERQQAMLRNLMRRRLITPLNPL